MKNVLFLLLLPMCLTAQTAFERGVDLFEQEKFDLARTAFQQHLASQPGHQKTVEYLGDIAGYKKSWDEAIEHYKVLLDEKPNNATYNFKYGGALGMKALEVSKFRAVTYIGDIKEHFLKAAELDPNHIEVRWALVELYMQLPAIIGGSEKKALSYAEELQEISPVDGYLAKGYIAEYNERPNDAEYYYRKAVEVGDSPHTYEKLSEHYEKNNKPKQALETARISLEKHKRNRLNYQIGKISAQYDIEPMLGIKCLRAYIDNHSVRDGVPVDWAYYRLAQIYKNLGDKATALNWIEKALDSRPDFDQALEERARILAL